MGGGREMATQNQEMVDTQMRVALPVILGAVVAAALSATAYQWLWNTSSDTAGAKGILNVTATVLVTVTGAILGGFGAAWATMPRRAFFFFLGLFILAAALKWIWDPSSLGGPNTLSTAFPAGSLLVGRVLGWLVGARGRNRSTATTAD
jgi:hypothetical protein